MLRRIDLVEIHINYGDIHRSSEPLGVINFNTLENFHANILTSLKSSMLISGKTALRERLTLRNLQ